jgi:glycerol-3-phosphate dehydrogenase
MGPSLTEPLPLRRADLIARIRSAGAFDVAIIGGGATGLGVALEACLRGYRTVLLEGCDFAKGTSSRATKLLHGGVRYLAQGQVGLVREALRERRRVLASAPHLASPLRFVLPAYRSLELGQFAAGLCLYQALAGRSSLGRTSVQLGRTALGDEAKLLRPGVKGAVRYWDAQFDDARLAVASARTAVALDACVINHCAVEQLTFDSAGRVVGLRAVDCEKGESISIAARCVVNAAGVWAGRWLDGAGGTRNEAVQPSQGAHIVVSREFWPSDEALLIPRTSDGRVLFVVPWLGATLIGTTDHPVDSPALEPLPMREEVLQILADAAAYLARPPSEADIQSVWAGLRPLVRSRPGAKKATSALSREHAVVVDDSTLVTVTGGKWTTYRSMGEDVLNHCSRAGLLPSRTPAPDVRLIGAPMHPVTALCEPAGEHLYGSEAGWLLQLPGGDTYLAPGFSEAMVRFAVRHEFARTVEDVLARRSRLLFVDARRALECGPRVAEIIGEESDHDPALAAFQVLARQYIWRG